MQFETTSQPGVKNSLSLSQHLHFQGLVETYTVNIYERGQEMVIGEKSAYLVEIVIRHGAALAEARWLSYVVAPAPTISK